MRSRLYLSILAVASLLGSTLIASAQGPDNSAGSTVPRTSTPVDPVGSDPSGRSKPSEITTGGATTVHSPDKQNHPAAATSMMPTPPAGPTTSGHTVDTR
jgi:hypothetical protein